MDENYIDTSFSEEEIAASLNGNRKAEYDEEYILKSLLEGKTREDLASEFLHKSYKTIDMYMRRRGYSWEPNRQTYISKPAITINNEPNIASNKVQKIVSLFNSGTDPREIAKRVGMKDHRAMATYMKSKGYIWSSEKQNYILLKGQQPKENPLIDHYNNDYSNDTHDNFDNFDNFDDFDDFSDDTSSVENSFDTINIPTHISKESISANSKLEKLLPMLEMMDRNRDKLAELLGVNTSNTIPRYIVGGITITKSLCMSHPLSELIKEFSKEKNISQREIFEVAIIEFLRKYGYENEINALFMN